MRSRYEVADVLRQSGEEFIKQYNPPFHVQKVISDISTCRTAAKGAHQNSCSKCGKAEISYNSCRNRSCPKCEGHKQAQWVEEREKELLSVPYFHLVFTLPHQLNPLIIKHRKECFDILFKAVSETLLEVANRQLEGLPGFFCILHTWGRNLTFHPHLHVVMPGGVWKNSDNKFNQTSRKYLLPIPILSTVFRAKFIQKLKSTRLILPDEKPFLKQLFLKNWVVYAKPPFGGPEAVLKYLARYTHRIAISNSRLTSITSDSVTFKYLDPKDSKAKLCSLTHLEFTRRFLQHVPPPGFVRIRYYGYLAHAKRNQLLPKIKQTLSVIVTACGKEKPSLLKLEIRLSPCCLAPVLIKSLTKAELLTLNPINPWNST